MAGLDDDIGAFGLDDPTPQPTSGDDRPRWACPDGGTCHHECEAPCWHVINAGPLSGVFPGDEWPSALVAIVRDHAAVTKNLAGMRDVVLPELRHQVHLYSTEIAEIRTTLAAVTQERDALREFFDAHRAKIQAVRDNDATAWRIADRRLDAARVALGDTPSDECPGCQGRGWVWEGGPASEGEGTPADCPVCDDAARAALGDTP